MSEVGIFFGQFAASFCFIFLRAFQQRNVAFDNLGWILPTSMLMALTEAYVISNIANVGFGLTLVVAMGLGGGLGSILAALLHKNYIKKD